MEVKYKKVLPAEYFAQLLVEYRAYVRSLGDRDFKVSKISVERVQEVFSMCHLPAKQNLTWTSNFMDIDWDILGVPPADVPTFVEAIFEKCLKVARDASPTSEMRNFQPRRVCVECALIAPSMDRLKTCFFSKDNTIIKHNRKHHDGLRRRVRSLPIMNPAAIAIVAVVTAIRERYGGKTTDYTKQWMLEFALNSASYESSDESEPEEVASREQQTPLRQLSDKQDAGEGASGGASESENESDLDSPPLPTLSSSLMKQAKDLRKKLSDTSTDDEGSPPRKKARGSGPPPQRG